MMVVSRNITFCKDGIYDASLFERPTFRPSLCLQFAALSVPSIFIFLGIPYAILNYKKSKLIPTTRITFGVAQWLQVSLASCVLITVVTALASGAIIDATYGDGCVEILEYISLLAGVLGLVVYISLSEYLRRLHQPRSQLLFSFTLLLFFAGLLRFWGILASSWDEKLPAKPRTMTERTMEQIQLYTAAFFVCLTFAQLLTHFFSPHTQANSLLIDQNACPELWASVPSLWTFSWLRSIIWKAYWGRMKKPEDVFSVRLSEAVGPNYRKFWMAWENTVSRRMTKPNTHKSSSSIVITSDEVPLLHDPHDATPGKRQTSATATPHVKFRHASCNDAKPKPSGSTDMKHVHVKEDKVVLEKHTWALLVALSRAFGGRLLLAWVFLLLGVLLNYAPPILLGYLLRFLASHNAPLWQGYAIAMSMLVAGLINTVVDQQGYYGCLSLGVSVRSALTAAVYRKSLRLSSEARVKYTTGELINLLSVDVNRVMESFMFSFFVWTALVQFLLSFFLLWKQLGIATLAGIGCLLLMLPLNVLFMWLTQKFQVSEMSWKDKRMKCLGEVFGAIKVIKLYAWEKAFEKQANDIRRRELAQMFRVAVGWSSAQLVWSLAPYLILLLTFVTYTREFLFPSLAPKGTFKGETGNHTVVPQMLDPERIFVSVSLFNLMRAPLIMLPWSLSAIIMAFVSIRRLAKFLLAPEINTNSVERLPFMPDDTSPVISFENASFSWSGSGPLVLQDLNLNIRSGWLVAVVGSVGAGKSSLISACLGEMIKRSGSVKLKGSIAYVPQSAWLQQMTLRENVCFGQPVGEHGQSACGMDWYQTVVSACALQPDIDRLPGGDQTELGEKGVNLSGGQRQRISLARAVYQDCDVYLMDDCLSAVDTHVGQELFEKVLGPKGLLRKKTRILTTNSFSWLNQADWIVVLSQDGTIAQSGTYQDIINNTSGQFTEYLHQLRQELRVVKKARSHSFSKTSLTSTHSHRRVSVSIPSVSIMDTTPSTTKTNIHHRGSLALSTVQDTMSVYHFLARSPPQANHRIRRVSVTENDSNGSTGNETEEENMDNTSEKSFGKHKPGTSEQDANNRSNLPVIRIRSTTEASATLKDVESVVNEECSDAASNDSDSEFGRFVADEEVMQGHVRLSTYWRCMVDRGILASAILLLSYAGFLGIQLFSNYWLQWFADDPDLIQAEQALRNETIFGNSTARHMLYRLIGDRTKYYIFGYTWTGVGQVVLISVHVTSHIYSSLRASKVMHQSLLSSILRTSTSFFDRTPLGRVLNRFSNDVDSLDHQIPDAVIEIISCVGDTFIALLVVTLALRPLGLGLVIVVPLGLACLMIQSLYLPCSRQARRLDAVTRSPLLANFGETAASALGVTVVRAFGRTDMFVATADQLVDRNAVHAFLRYASNRWLEIYLGIFNHLMVFVTTVVLIVYRDRFTAGLAGLIIIYALQTSENFTWLAKQYAQLETSAVSLERIREYSSLQPERYWEKGPDSPPPDNWPGPCCQVIFNKATVRYLPPKPNSERKNFEDAETALVEAEKSEELPEMVTALKSVDLVLSGYRDGRRIGIVGRTGAGKSSLASCIFRLVEATVTANDRELISGPFASCGPVIVDGIDLHRIGLQELRSRFSILPQDPVLFSGSLRFNLDPFGVQSDAQLWSALESAHLATWARTEGIGLDYECGESGCNLSAGQRQLVCLARIFLSSGGRVRLLILDEATAAMDPATDRLVMQTVIRDQFQDATVIVIAHRLATVMDTDRIIVLDGGCVVESGRPHDLLANPQSRFANMYHAGQ
ncbi:unnamed protein product [Calicophoron daubneyi]|uniref:Uncharacterized protein n=1 Tax=Calicophoron daubneyi TaxID=300641 RepID=A0AAV2T683_CALDB